MLVEFGLEFRHKCEMCGGERRNAENVHVVVDRLTRGLGRRRKQCADFDLKAHSKKPENEEGKRINPDTTEDLSYFDEATKQRFYPYVIEPAAGVNRTVLAILMDAYSEKTNDKGETRVILKLHHSMAPIKVAVLPLAKNKPEIVGMAKAIKRSLQPIMRSVYDDTGGIGKLYARQDEVGTPFCVTVDHQSLEDEGVTVRDRDTWEQERVKVSELPTYLRRRFASKPGP